MRSLKIHKGFRALRSDPRYVVTVCGVKAWVENGNWAGGWDKVTCERCRASYRADMKAELKAWSR